MNLEGFLEKFLKIKSALKSTGKSLKSLEKSLNSQSSRKRRIRRIFTLTFGFVRIHFLLGILIYANFFSADTSQTP